MSKRSTLDSRTRYELTKAVEVFVNSQRRGKVTSATFRKEMSEAFAVDFSLGNIEGAVSSVGQKMCEVFATDPRQGASPFAQMYKLEQRISALENKLSDFQRELKHVSVEQKSE